MKKQSIKSLFIISLLVLPINMIILNITHNFTLQEEDISNRNPSDDNLKNINSTPSIKILSYSSDSGWYDPYYKLAFRWAPVIYQDTDDTDYRADYITKFDFDNNYIGNNNWDNMPYYPLPGYVYYAVMETDTHYYIFYLFFHPRDWSDYLPGIDEHENDMEGVWLMILKDGSEYGSLVAMETEAHNQIYQYSNDPSVGSNSDDVDGGIIMVDSGGFSRPSVFVEAKGHGVKNWDGSDFPGGDGVVYHPSTIAEEPENGNDRYVPYDLLPLFTTLWPKRYEIGDGKTYDKPFTYQKTITYQGNTINFQAVNIPQSFDGNDANDDAANPPWGWDDPDDDAVYIGDIFFDPAYTFSTHLSFSHEVSLNYIYHPYIKSILTYQNEGRMEEFTPPTITLSSPNDNELVSETFTIRFIVSDSSKISKITVTMDGSVKYQENLDTSYQVIEVPITTYDDGLHTINITAIDEWGNYRWVQIDIIVDATDPTLRILYPTDNLVIYGNNFTGIWEGNDNYGIANFEVKIDDSNWINVGSSTSYFFDNLAEGYHLFYVRATDLVGHTQIASMPFYIKLTVPKIAFNMANYSYFNKTEVTISWTVSGNITNQWIKKEDGVWELYSNSGYIWSNLNEGMHKFSVKVEDDIGYYYESTIIFVVDMTPPDITITSHENNTVTGSTNILLRWNSSDINGIMDEYIDRGSDWEKVIGGSAEINLNNGWNEILIKSIDIAGNEKVVKFRIFLDSKSPIVHIENINDGDMLPSAFRLYFNATDLESSLNQIIVYLDGTEIYSLSPNTATFEGSLDFSNITAGSHIIRVRAVDSVGNMNYAEVVFQVQHVSIQYTYRYNYLNVSQDSVTLNLTAYGKIQHFYVYVNGTKVYEENVGLTEISKINLTKTISLKDEGVYEVKAEVVGPSSNDYAYTILRVIYDKTPPILRLISNIPSITNQRVINITWVSSDSLSRVKSYSARVNGSSWLSLGKNNHFSIEVETGFYIVEIMAEDYAGNYEIKSLSFEVDIDEPSIEILNPHNYDKVNTTFTISWSAKDNKGINHFEIVIDNNTPIFVDSSYSSYNLTISPGRHEIKVIVVDIAGNKASDDIVIYVENASANNVNMLQSPLAMNHIILALVVLIALTITYILYKRKRKYQY